MIVGLGHAARTGKDTVAGILVERHGFTRVAFADALRSLVYDIDIVCAWMVDDFGGWDAAKVGAPTLVRDPLVKIGSACRQHVGEDVWINALAAKLEAGRDYVIPDLRYPNEAEWIKYGAVIDHSSVFGVAVKITRPGVDPLDNIADQALADFDGWDCIISNDGSVDDLAAKADGLVALLRRGNQ